MSRSDPLLMLADIARLVSEHGDLDEALIRAIYQHEVLTTSRQPGDVVVPVIENEATLKHFYREGRCIHLEPGQP